MFSWNEYPRYRISPTRPSQIRHNDIVQAIQSFQEAHPRKVLVEQVGSSAEGRPISKLTLGSGPKKILAWSQMHGNEPTHTAALLDLINFLLQASEHPVASAILEHCTLHAILMLNPDGAERWTRRNAQDIDINRDAIHLQSPEGQLLQQVVNAVQPDFALNLHNQRPRTTVDRSQQVASFSLLVPPIDAADSDAEHVVRARQLASTIAEQVALHAAGPISRYDADFMPRCFGEWIQQQGAATITFEAGGWSTVDDETLVQLHFFGLITCLEAIAAGSYLSASPNVYEALPRTGEHDLHDLLFRKVRIFNGHTQSSYRVDLGIDFDTTVPSTQDGRIADLGDLRVTSGKTLVDATSLACLPGRIAWQADVTPRNFLDKTHHAALLAQGVTTMLGHVDLANKSEVDAFLQLPLRLELPLNLGFVAAIASWSPDACKRLIGVISQGILGVVAEPLPAEVAEYLDWFQLPLIDPSSLLTDHLDSASLAECASQTHQCARLLGQTRRDGIQLGAVADLAFINCVEPEAAMADIDLHQVLVGGNVVFDQGQLTGECPGVLLTRSINRKRTSD